MQIAYIHAGLTSRLHLYLEGHGDKQFFFVFYFYECFIWKAMYMMYILTFCFCEGDNGFYFTLLIKWCCFVVRH